MDTRTHLKEETRINESIFNAMEQLSSSERLITSPDEISNTIKEIEKKLIARMPFYAENNFEYFIDFNLDNFELNTINQLTPHLLSILDNNPHQVTSLREGIPCEPYSNYLIGPFYKNLESLSFKKDKELNAMRLFHTTRTFYGISHTYYNTLNDNPSHFIYACFEQVIIKPLIETKLNSRYLAYKHLSDFIIEFKNYCENDFPKQKENLELLASLPRVNEQVKTSEALIRKILLHHGLRNATADDIAF